MEDRRPELIGLFTFVVALLLPAVAFWVPSHLVGVVTVFSLLVVPLVGSLVAVWLMVEGRHAWGGLLLLLLVFSTSLWAFSLLQ